MTYLLASDQGTSSSRSIVFDAEGSIVRQRTTGAAPDLSHSPAGSSTTRKRSGARSSPPRARRWPRPASQRQRHHAPCGITNQRETTVVWNRAHWAAACTTPSSGRTGAPSPPAQRCASAGLARLFSRRPACCSTPISQAPSSQWILDHVPGARAAGRAAASWPSARWTAG